MKKTHHDDEIRKVPSMLHSASANADEQTNENLQSTPDNWNSDEARLDTDSPDHEVFVW